MGQLMGGEVGLDSRWKGGAAFYLEVPTAESAPLVGPDTGSPSMIVPERRSVLVVDDDEQARLALAGLFELHGWEVSAVADLAEARTRMAAGRLDLVITDWRLDRGERGSDIVAALKTLELDSPLILITGEGDPASHQAIAATGLPTLYKPISGKQILDLADRLSARDAG
jgi:DNA-binding NtrC family response regulator